VIPLFPVALPARVQCRNCPRWLTDPVSIARGYGPECAKQLGWVAPPAAKRAVFGRSRRGGPVEGQADVLAPEDDEDNKISNEEKTMANDWPEIADRFARETAEHEMTVLHDDGLYRHLRFMRPQNSAYWFDLITVPHALIFRGDGESFVFSRIEDMFGFFRSGIGADGTLRINPHYWSEKLTSDRDSVMKYDQDLFQQLVKEHVAEAIRERTAPRGISRAVRDLFENSDITWEDGARRALEAFEFGEGWKATCSCGEEATFEFLSEASSWRSSHITPSSVSHRTSVDRAEGWRFEDTWEWDFKGYDWWFLWACFGIVWGIQRYDVEKAAAPAEVETAGSVA
jgi:hypothetical protein